MINNATNTELIQYLKPTANIELKIQYAEKLSQAVPFDGWQDAVLMNISRDLGLSEYHYKLVFRGIAEALLFYEDYANAKMLQALAQENHSGVTNIITAALYLRILVTGGSKLMAKKTAAYYSKPQHTAAALKAAWRTADAIWYAAGDCATDYNYYTKRSLLSSIYLASLIYYLNNDNNGDIDDQQRTKDFITKALAKTAQFAKLTKKAKAAIPSTVDIPIIRMFF